MPKRNKYVLLNFIKYLEQTINPSLKENRFAGDKKCTLFYKFRYS